MFSTIVKKASEEAGKQPASQDEILNVKGRDLWKMLQEELKSPQADRDTEATFLASYDTTVKENQEILEPALKIVSGAYGCSTAYKCSTSSKGSQVAAYENYIDASKGFIIASYNYAKNDTNDKNFKLNNSQILWNQWVSVAKIQECQVGNLKEVLRSSIASNDVTLPILGKVVGIKNAITGRTLTPAETDFFTLLGTPNCYGVVYLLIQHSKALNLKTISKIFASRSYIRILLEPWKPPDEAVSSSSGSSS